MNFKLKIYKLKNWEYWSTPTIYLPMLPVWLYFSAKAKSLFFFHQTNPSLPFGGMAMDSKILIYNLIPEKHIPKTLFYKEKSYPKKIIEDLEKKEISFPIVIKPDIGLKGLGVEIIENSDKLIEHIKTCDYDIIIQEKIEFEKEIGIFYHRFPGEKKGKITGLVEKNFLHVIGNGKNTLRELVWQNPRSAFHEKTVRKRFPNEWNTIIPESEKFLLIPFGSHTRGAEFIDLSHKITEDLENVINEICSEIKGFYYGRLDVMYENLELLAQGKNFKIIELNGTKSEPTHMYDPKHSLFFAWKEIYRHWKIMSKISTINQNAGIKGIKLKKGWQILVDNLKIEKKLKKISIAG